MQSYLLVADVLGFSKILTNTSDNYLPERMKTWIDLVKNIQHDTNIKHVQLMSDTVFVHQEDHSKEGVDRLFQFSRILLERGLENSFPIRGAITYGHVSWEQELIYGKAVLDAALLERSLDWIGIACGPLPTVPWSWDLTCCYPVPKKSGEVLLSPAVVWTIPKADELVRRANSEGLMKAKEVYRWENYSKQINTLAFSKYIHLTKQEGLSPERFHGKFPSYFLVE